VKVGHCSAVLFLTVLLATSLGLSGCDSNSYSAAIRYLVRTDPLVTTDKLGPERYTPDRPGQLPLFSAKDLLEMPNPYYKDAADRESLAFFKKGDLIDPTKLSAEDRTALQDALDKLFGTPAQPKVDGIPTEAREKLGLSPEQLAKGSQYYRIQCLHCHGVTGNGRGPTSRWVNPHPRDYRQGLFKFQSVDQTLEGKAKQKPSRADLMRTLQEGIEGTAMPAFGLLSTHDLESLVSYVIHLSIRGEAEYLTIRRDFKFDEKKNVLVQTRPFLKDLPIITKKVGERWLESQSDPIPVAPYSDQKKMEISVQRGQALFEANEKRLKELFPDIKEEALDKLKAASCVSCHKDFGRQATFRFDEWGTLVRPADLTRSVYRGGGRPVDIYFRIHSGINGSGMANFGGILTGEQIWDIVNFVRALPFKAMRDKYALQIN